MAYKCCVRWTFKRAWFDCFSFWYLFSGEQCCANSLDCIKILHNRSLYFTIIHHSTFLDSMQQHLVGFWNKIRPYKTWYTKIIRRNSNWKCYNLLHREICNENRHVLTVYIFANFDCVRSSINMQVQTIIHNIWVFFLSLN